MDKDLEQLLSGEAIEPTPSLESTPKEKTPEEIQSEKEVVSKQTQLENLNKAVAEATGKLRELRKAKKEVAPEEDEIPKINMEDPSARAWDRHIRENVSPLQAELDKERSEVRGYALKEFLTDKPALARNPEKIKELMENYEKLHTASERNKEGVLMDLDRAYAATFHNELLNAARNRRVEEAKSDILFSDIAVSRGSTNYSSPKDTSPRLTDEDRELIKKMGYSSVDEWMKDKKKYE